MPKYVRTEKGIYEVIEENSNYYKCCYDNGRITLVAKFDNDVNGFSKALKQADTIAELCDEFVYEKGSGTNRGKPMISKNDFKSLSEWYVECGFKVNVIYGAIWTDEGLIYVAKMNEDGKLVLI